MSTKTPRPSLWQKLKPNKVLDTRALLVFERLVRFYNIFNVLTALIAGLSLAVLSFSEFHPCTIGLVFRRGVPYQLGNVRRRGSHARDNATVSV